MVATTTNQAIRYPQLTDRPCDWDLHLQWMAEDVDAKLDSHDADIARMTLGPSLILAVTSQVEIPVEPTVEIVTDDRTFPTQDHPFQAIPFDSVEHQAGGVFARPSVNPYLFSFPVLGVYQLGLEWEMNLDPLPDGVTSLDRNYIFQLFQYPELPTPGGQMAQREIRNFGEHSTVNTLLRVNTLGTLFWWQVGVAGAVAVDDAIHLNAARMGAFWVSDV